MPDRRLPVKEKKEITMISLLKNLALACIILFIYVYFLMPDDAMFSAAASAHIDVDDFMKLACTQKRFCKEYSSARQSCATAGSYRNCMTIKLENKRQQFLDYEGTTSGLCKNDGSLATQEDLIPSRMQCIASTVIEFRRSLY